MARYVDIDKAVEEARLNYCKNCNNYNGVKCRSCAFDDAMLEIEDAPTADVVEVVRCKDCIYKHTAESTPITYCKALSSGIIRPVIIEDNDFCSYGERKDGD